MTPRDWLARFGSRRVDRRQAGLLGAALLALLVAPEQAASRKRKRRTKRGRAERAEQAKRSRPRLQCGGIAGLPCPGGFTCIDDPNDDCDPRNGGADCFGICVRKGGEPCGRTRCGRGEYCCNLSCGVCAPIGGGCAAVYCTPEPKPETEPGEGGERCVKTFCPRGQSCCNASCGICAPLNSSWIMIACVEEIAE